jgi:hypothetical protein
MKSFEQYIGVDFSGAALAGRNAWLAHAVPGDDGRLRLVELRSLEQHAGTAERAEALAHLVRLVRDSSSALWAMDFPFGLPIELFSPPVDWAGQLQWLSQWQGGAGPLGVECVRRAKLLGGKLHIRRETDSLVKTPFDCYHYRIIYQTFHGMRDVLGPLAADRTLAVLPFEYERLKTARSVVIEACPSSTLKRLGLPHHNYKQPTGGPLVPKRRRTRQTILAGLSSLIELSDAHRRIIMRNPGGDALDAVLAAAGAWQAWPGTDHAAVAGHPRFPLEGFVYA